MERDEALREEAEALEQSLWEMTAEQLVPVGAALTSALAAQGLDLPRLLAELSDEGLALAIQKRCFVPEAFVELFVNRYTNYLARWFYGWQADPELAADLKQEVFLRFLQSRLGSYRPAESFRTYLYATAYHLWVERRRRVKRSDSLEVVPEPQSKGVSPEEWAQRHELAARFQTALARLPDDERAVLELAVDGKTHDEIAAQLGRPKPWVYARLFRARRAVESELGLPPRPRDRQRGRGEPVS
jgi:RNA polymerase sigma factor (sigma-70 family)